MPRHPTPCPRELPQFRTRHAVAQAKRRGIAEAQIIEAIKHGRELATDEKGQKGGFISKFYKSFVEHRDGSPTSKSIVAVCEVFADRYVLLTCYKDNPGIK